MSEHPPLARPLQTRTRRAPQTTALPRRLHLLALAATAARYLTSVQPAVRRELAHWEASAHNIPDPALRGCALDALSKRGNMEGAALFAALAPRPLCPHTIRALVTYQSTYNYLDTLAERITEDPTAASRRLHQALLTSLQPHVAHPDYYEHLPHNADGGYLTMLVETSRRTLTALPSFHIAAPHAVRAAERIVEFQALNLGARQGTTEQLEAWARRNTPDGSDLHWWEYAAAAGSSLGVHALIAASATPRLTPVQAKTLEQAYHPSAGALHSLLDSLVDRHEDREAEQHSLLGHYDIPAQAAVRMGVLAARARSSLSELPRAGGHTVILAAMSGHYLSDPQAKSALVRPVARAVRRGVGPPVSSVLALSRMRRLTGGPRS